MSFEAWMAEVDSLVQDRVGLGVDDFPDFPSRDWYDSEVSPREAVKMAAQEYWDDLDGVFL